MLHIEIKSDFPGEGKSRTAHAIAEYWQDWGRNAKIIEGYIPGASYVMDLTGIDVLIKVIQ